MTMEVDWATKEEILYGSPAYWRLVRMMRFLYNLVGKVEIVGAEKIPREGGVIIAINHLGRLDTPLVAIASPRKLTPFGAAKYRSWPIFRQLMEAANVIWVQRGEIDREALQKALAVLRLGGGLGIAPEGTRSPTRALQRGKEGVAYLASRADVPIVPAGVTGTERLKDDLGHLRRMHMRIVFGEPFRLPAGRLRGDELTEAADLVMRKIAALLPPAYRGVYAEAVGGGGVPQDVR